MGVTLSLVSKSISKVYNLVGIFEPFNNTLSTIQN